MDKQVRYILDEINPNNPSNMVRGEAHRLEDRRFKCLVPYHGSFYAGSVRVVQSKTNYQLIHNVDFVYSDIDIETTEKLGEPVANVLIILKMSLGHDFTIDYRAVGLPIKQATERTVALLEAPEDGLVSDSYIDVRKKPALFDPTFHYHKLNDIEHFEQMLFYLEKIRIALIYEATTPIREYLTKIEASVQVLYERATSKFFTDIEINFKKFRDAFNRESFQVERLTNVGLMNYQDAYKAAKGTDKRSSPEGLLAMRALISFKTGIYETYLGSDRTLLGNVNGTVIPPTLENYFELVIGTTALIDTYSNNTNKSMVFDRMAYPNVARSNSRFNIRKIVNDMGTRCIVTATEIESAQVFIGKITKTNVGYLAEWREVVRPDAINTSVLGVTTHVSDHGNPHKDSKDHIELGLVENIPVGNIFDIVTDSVERKYLRWDLLESYMKKFLVRRRPNKTEQLEDADENLMRNISVVFSQCGRDCTTGNECHVIEPVYTLPPPTYSITPSVSRIGIAREIVTTTTTTTTPPPVTTTTTTTTTAPPANDIGLYMTGYRIGSPSELAIRNGGVIDELRLIDYEDNYSNPSVGCSMHDGSMVLKINGLPSGAGLEVKAYFPNEGGEFIFTTLEQMMYWNDPIDNQPDVNIEDWLEYSTFEEAGDYYLRIKDTVGGDGTKEWIIVVMVSNINYGDIKSIAIPVIVHPWNDEVEGGWGFGIGVQYDYMQGTSKFPLTNWQHRGEDY